MKINLFQRLILQALFLITFGLLTGCSSSSHSDPSQYNLMFQAHPQVNNAAPLKVRVMLLKSDADFMSADFYSLQNNAAALLGGNLLNSEQRVIGFWQNIKLLMAKSGDCCRYPRRRRPFLQILAELTDELKAEIIADINGLRAVQ
ncbi:hypothetical protein L0F63_005375 [Massospora cicadina]|nr:hypothetical protein L0F63_005375 [Massospora cicadina]